METETLKDRLIEYARWRGLKIISANIYICIERYPDEESDEVTIEKRLALLPKKYTEGEYNKFLDLLDVEEYSDEHIINYMLGTIYFNKGGVVNIEPSQEYDGWIFKDVKRISKKDLIKVYNEEVYL